MAYQQSDLDKLDAKILGSTKKVTFADGRSLENYDLDQLRRLRADIVAELGVASTASRGRPRFIVGRVGRLR